MKITGVVSNCWDAQLKSGTSLQLLIERAVADGLSDIELRQGSLGNCEDSSLIPVATKLDSLASGVPETRLNLAIDIPFLSHMSDREAALFQESLVAAQALSPTQPHLRMVDLTTALRFDVEHASRQLRSLQEEAAIAGVRLSIEHSRQNWEQFGRVMETVPETCLCLDPCNLLMLEPDLGAIRIIGELDQQRISMLHVKQFVRRSDRPQVLPNLAAGIVPWQEVIRTVENMHYSGPVMLETAPGEDIDVLFKETRDMFARL